MNKPKLLFVCTFNRWRSLTAEMIFKADPRFDARSAGISPNARHQISAKDIEWADQILCMENRHREFIAAKFAGYPLPPLTVLEIDSGYQYMDPELIELLKARVAELPLIKAAQTQT